MSLITQCPACKTMFKVVADQLQVSEGWVRCGQCQEVFDANVHLNPEPLLDVDLSVVHKESVEIPSALPERMRSAIEPQIFKMATPDADTSLDIVLGDIGEIRPDNDPPFMPEAAEPITTKPPAFLQTSHQPRHRSSAWERAGLCLVILLLTGGLGVQFIAQERDWIAAHKPELKPWLENFCDAMKCRVRSLRQIDAVLIENSSFTKIRPDVFLLNFSVKNTSAVAVAVPAIELSLTDTHDQAVVRKVIREHELGIHANMLSPDEPGVGTVTVSLNAAGIAERIAGYRILAFYP